MNIRKRLFVLGALSLSLVATGAFAKDDKATKQAEVVTKTEAARKICRERYLQFGCEGQAAKIAAEPLTMIAKRYAQGELAQTVV